MQIKNGEKIWQGRGLIDTGNSLKEPISGRPVHIVSSDVANAVTAGNAGYMAIPYRSMGNPCGILNGYRVDEITAGTVKRKGAVIAVNDGGGSKMIRKLILKILEAIGGNVFYIGGNDVLPPPLSSEEEKKIIKEFETGSLDARNILVEHNLRLVVYIARKFENAGVNVEDLISIGTIGLIKAVNTFKSDKNIKLATYASRCIENEILMYLRRNNRIKNEVSFDEPLNIDWDGNELLLSDILGTENDEVYHHIEEEVNYSLLSYVMKKLSQREKVIMEMRFGLVNGEEMTQKEVADEIGISQSYISRLEKKIISRMQKEIKKLG